jgi:predicted RNA binding protein YcfA (HicA-like mRNA interferase family)
MNSFGFFGRKATGKSGKRVILKHPTLPMLVVPFHRGDIPRGLFLRILKDAGFSERDFLEG